MMVLEAIRLPLLHGGAGVVLFADGLLLVIPYFVLLFLFFLPFKFYFGH
jgi:prepilin-type processing-associated H-X9-DG protein